MDPSSHRATGPLANALLTNSVSAVSRHADAVDTRPGEVPGLGGTEQVENHLQVIGPEPAQQTGVKRNYTIADADLAIGSRRLWCWRVVMIGAIIRV